MLRLRTYRRAIVLPLLAAALAVLSVYGGGAPRAGAHAGTHANMVLEMTGGAGLGSGCYAGQAAPWNECSAPVGGVFTAGLFMQTQDVSYRYVQFAVAYSGVTSKNDPVWVGPDECLSTTVDAQPGSLLVSCTVDDTPSAVAVVGINFNCTNTTSSNNEIKLIVGLGDGESHIRDASSVRHSNGTYTASMFVDCIVPQRADMHLEMKSGSATCDSMSNPTACTVPPGGSFLLGVATNDPPPQGYFGMTTEVLYGGLQYNPAPDDPRTSPFPHEGAEQEVVWPGASYAARDPFFTITGTEGYVRHYADGGAQHYTGNLVELSMTCQQPGVYPVTLTSFDHPNRPHGSEFFAVTTSNQDNAVRLNSEDTINVTCLAPPTSTPTRTPTATPTRTRVPPELGGVAERLDLGSGGFGLWAGLAAAAAGLLILGAGGLVLRLRRLP